MDHSDVEYVTWGDFETYLNIDINWLVRGKLVAQDISNLMSLFNQFSELLTASVSCPPDSNPFPEMPVGKNLKQLAAQQRWATFQVSTINGQPTLSPRLPLSPSERVQFRHLNFINPYRTKFVCLDG